PCTRASMKKAAFASHIQPIIELDGGRIAGYEALTRFTSHKAPAPIFAAATRAGLGVELEEATLVRAVRAADALPAGVFLSVNASPEFISSGKLGRTLEGLPRPVVLEVTEHAPIDNYASIRRSITDLGTNVRLAVDDAGAGFASFRHILELAPDYVKLDIALVRG